MVSKKMAQEISIGNKILDILKKTNYPFDDLIADNFEWIAEIPNIQDFVMWFTYTITDDNCLCEEDIILFKHLKKSNSIQTEEQLDRQLNMYTCTLSMPMTQYNSPSDESHLLGVNELAHQLNNLTFLRKSILEEKSALTDQKEVVKIQKKRIDNHIKTEKRGLMEHVTKCSGLVGDAENKWTELKNNISLVHESQLYFHQQPLEDYLQLNESFETLLESAKSQLGVDIQSQKDGKLHVPISVVYENKKQETTEIGTCNLLSKIYFDTNSMLYHSNTSSSMAGSFLNQSRRMLQNSGNCEFINRHVQRAAFGIQQSEIDYILATSEYTGVLKSLQFLNDLKSKILKKTIDLSYHEIRVFIPKFKPLEKLTEKQLWSMCQTYVQSLLVGKGSEEKIKKMEHRMKRLTYLIDLETCIRKHKPLNHILLMLLHQEAKILMASENLLLKSRDIFYQIRIKNQHRKDRVYDEIKNDYMHSYKRTPVLKTLGLMLLDKTYMGSNVYYEDITYAIEQLDMGVIKAHEQITVSLNKQIEVLKKDLKCLRHLENYLFVTPTRALDIYKGDAIERINGLRDRLKVIETNITNIKRKLSKKKVLLEKPYRKKLHYLWMDYLLQPKILISDLIKIEYEVNSVIKENEIRIQGTRID